MNPDVGQIVWFTIWVALLASIILLPLGLPVAWLLAKRTWTGKTLIETLVALPLVLPPVATGLILLKLFGRRGPAGAFLYNQFGVEIVFTWKAVLISLVVMSFPLFVRAARSAFESVNPRLEQIAMSLGANPWRVFATITLPLATRGILGGLFLGFARALGEFGATIMLAGNIAGETTTISLAIFHEVQLGNDKVAFSLAMISIVIAFAAVFAGEWLIGKRRVH